MDLHRELKLYAEQILREKGCVVVKEEYHVLIDGRPLIVDVVGMSLSRWIAVECNNTNPASEEKIQLLKKRFDEVIEVSVADYVMHLKDRVAELEKFVTTVHLL